MGNLTAVNVKDGGTLIDTNGNTVTITNDLVNFGGISTGGLSKSGLGTLTLSGTNNHTGDEPETAPHIYQKIGFFDLS